MEYLIVLPNGLGWLEVKAVVDFTHAEWTVHLSWEQPLLDAGKTVDMITRKIQRIMRVSHTHWTWLETEPGCTATHRLNFSGMTDFIHCFLRLVIFVPKNPIICSIFAGFENGNNCFK